MSDWLRRIGGGTDGPGRDIELAQALAGLDPAVDDPNYWFRFRGWVMSAAARELARRRLVSQLTVGEVMSAWARTLLPTAVLAAALAGMLLVRSDVAPSPRPLLLEEALVTGIPGETVPVLLTPDGTEGVVAFASERY